MSAEATLIVPDQLEADAVVPQCLDNQYVSDDVFSYLIQHRTDYDDAAVVKRRKEEIQTEFIRSLVYSSQVVINRASMMNNDYLYQNYLPENTASFEAFSKLARQRAVIPFLLNESSLTEKVGYSVRPDGERAIQALLDKTGDMTCVRLAKDDRTNRKATAEMAGHFLDGLTRLKRLDDEQRNAMASELFTDLTSLHREGGWDTFTRALKELASYAFEKEKVTRTDIYRDFLVAKDRGADAIEMGRFRNPEETPFLLPRKKLVDLIYNTNLPDRLKRHTFTPIGLPSRTALQDEPTISAGAEKLDQILTDPDMLDFIRQTFMANTQKAMTLPLLGDLTVADVVELRNLEEWEAFKESQRKILLNPLQSLELFEPFQTSFDAFQRAMSEWYNEKYQKERTKGKYVSFITWAVKIAGKLIVLGLGHDHPVLKEAVGFVPDLIPKKVSGYAAKLLVSVYDLGERQLDKDRSYSLDLMRTAEEFTREDTEDLIHRMTEKNQSVDTDTGRPAADQGQK